MKRMGRYLLSLTLIAMALLTVRCSGGSDADDAYVGKWYVMKYGTAGLVDRMEEEKFHTSYIEIKDGKKGLILLENEEIGLTYKVEDTAITFTIEGNDYEGTIDGDKMIIDDMEGVHFEFGKEGTDAANLSAWLTDMEKSLVGTWKPVSALNALNEELEDIDGMALEESLKLEFKDDFTVAMTFLGTEYSDVTWSGGFDILTTDIASEEFTLLPELDGDTLTFSITNMDLYYEFIMEKE